MLARLIEDLRTLSLAEAGTLALHREPTDLSIVAAEVARSFEQLAGTAGATIELELADDLPLLDVDPIRMREVLANLVANALRYVGPGWDGPDRRSLDAPTASSSRSSTTGRASPPSCCRRSSTASPSRRIPGAPASGWRSRARSSSHMAAALPPRARRAAERPSGSCFRAPDRPAADGPSGTIPAPWGYSSVGRAPAWHAGGPGFESP